MSPTNSFCAMNEASTHRGDASEMFSKHSENAFSTMNSSFYHNLSYDSNPRNCIICHRWINRKYEIDLDCTTLSDSGYICQSCRDSPVSAAEVPLAATSVDSLNASPTSIPPQDGVHAAFEIMQLNAAGHSDSSLNDVNCLDPYNEIFSTSSQQMDDIPSTALTTYPNHRRKAPEQESSMYYMEAGVNDADDLQALIRRNKCEGISCSSRGGRGGFSKGLATMPRSSSSKGRSFSTSNDLYSTNSFGRGQRAMRSGIKSGRGRRPRGGKASVVISTLVSAANNAVATNTVAPPNTQIEQEKVCTEVILPNKYDKMGINSRAVLVTSIEHTFFLQKPICLICGSVGNDAEGAMVSCSSCAQSYHTFCVWIHDKVSQAVLKRGWRCHNCLVCESCGEMKRETAAFISCFECGMFYHTNCLPAVGYYHNPHASWRCKWCSTCRRCGKQLLKCGDMRRTEGLCELCFSLHKCSKCYRLYETGDEIIKCQQCDRWCHGKCEEICGEEVLDAVCESGFRCSSCRPHGKFQINDASNAIACDNVMLNRCAMEILQARYGGLLMRSNPQYLNESTYGPYGARGRPFDDLRTHFVRTGRSSDYYQIYIQFRY